MSVYVLCYFCGRKEETDGKQAGKLHFMYITRVIL